MLSLLQSHPLHLLAIALIGFLIGRLSAPNPIERERQRQEREAARIGSHAALKPEAMAAVRALMKDGKKIEAIKLVRAELGIDLRDAKTLVESIGG